MQMRSRRVSGIPHIPELVSRREGESVDVRCLRRVKQVVQLIRRKGVRLQMSVDHIEVRRSGSQIQAIPGTRIIWVIPSQRIRAYDQYLVLRRKQWMVFPV